MSRLDLAARGGNWPMSMDPDLADLEAEVMGGSVVDYDFGQAPLPDIASDIQEGSIGQATPQQRNMVRSCHSERVSADRMNSCLTFFSPWPVTLPL